MVLVDESLIVCGHNSEEDGGIVVLLAVNLGSVKWSAGVGGQIKSTHTQGTLANRLRLLCLLNSHGGVGISLHASHKHTMSRARSIDGKNINVTMR